MPKTKPVEMNLRELAAHLGYSVPGLTALLQKHPSFPVLERGGKGKRWRFDPKAVTKYLQRRKNQQQAAETARASVPPIPPLLTPRSTGSQDDQLKTLRIRQLEREEAEIHGRLVQVDEVKEVLGRIFRLLGQAQGSFAETFARTHNLPDSLKRAMEADLNQMRIDAVRNCTKFIAADYEQQNGPGSWQWPPT